MNTVLWKYLESANPSELASTFQAWRNARPGLGILALVSEHEKDAVAMLQDAANSEIVPLAGAIVPGLITNGAFSRKGLLLLALDAHIPQAIVPLPRNGSFTDNSAVTELAAFVERNLGEDGADTLLLFIDAMTPDVSSLLDKLYLAVGSQVNYAGSNVGSETFQPIPCIFNNTSFVENAALALMLPQHSGAMLAHRYASAAPLGIATSTTLNRVTTINGMPAFDLYRELAASKLGVELTRENFYQHAVHFPLAQQMAEGEPLVRIPVGVDAEGSLYCVGEVRESSMMSIMKAPEPGRTDTAQDVAAHVSLQKPSAITVFYCAGRLMHQGEKAAAAELAHLRDLLAPVPLFGALSLGEIANYQGHGYPRFHNATIVALPWN